MHLELNAFTSAKRTASVVCVHVPIFVSLGRLSFSDRTQPKRHGRAVVGAGPCTADKGGRWEIVGENHRFPATEEDRKQKRSGLGEKQVSPPTRPKSRRYWIQGTDILCLRRTQKR